MDNHQFQALLKDLQPGKTVFFHSTTSTNDIAAEWVQQKAPDFSIIAADSQTKGRGRSGRKWYTNPGSALAFSVILKPPIDHAYFSRYTALGAIAVCHAISQISDDIPVMIKWPNDVLIENKKFAGVLTEMIWKGSQPEAIIIGIGVNITGESLLINERLNYPASYLDAYTQHRSDRFEVLHDILSWIKIWRNRIASHKFIEKWESLLAFRDQEIEVLLNNPEITNSDQPSVSVTGKLVGIDQNGQLLVKIAGDETRSFAANEIKILLKE